MKKILISCGPIPGKLDSVKYITNRFKGGLAFKTAESLASEFEVTIIKWKFTDYNGKLNTINIDDIFQYYDYIINNKYDVYILAGAVANLIPSDPWEGKFPSHNYKVGDEIDIKFTIAPRVIDEIKKKYPLSTLIGYKLFDGTEDELIQAGFETLKHSRSNCVFCNHPSTAKDKKIALLPDGTIHEMGWNEHITFIKRILNLEWYKTDQTILNSIDYKKWSFIDKNLESDLNFLLDNIKIKRNNYYFGTVAYNDSGNIISTSRGKLGKLFLKSHNVLHKGYNTILGPKMTLNMPLLDLLFKKYPRYNVILHGHKQLENILTIPHYFDGTTETIDVVNSLPLKNLNTFNVDKHGYYAMFKTIEAAKYWLKRLNIVEILDSLNIE